MEIPEPAILLPAAEAVPAALPVAAAGVAAEVHLLPGPPRAATSRYSKLNRIQMDLLDRINSEGKTVILSTHDVDAAYSWADYVYVMKDGALAGEGLPENVFQDDGLLQQADLEKPWLVEMFGELKKKGWLSNGTPPPRTKSDLFEIIPVNLQPRQKSVSSTAS